MNLGHDIKGSTYCEFYNSTKCIDSEEGCSGREECGTSDPDKRNHCYVLWKYDSVLKTSDIVLKVCYFPNLTNIQY